MSSPNKLQKGAKHETPAVAKKRVEDEDGSDIDLGSLSQKWTPDRVIPRADMKVRSLADGNLRGGCFILDIDGDATTISFLFEKASTTYGLTAGHLADVGDSVFCFFLSTKTPNVYDEGSSYEMLEIGEVVSKDVSTDSLVFEITNSYMEGRVDHLKLLAESGLGEKTLQLPMTNEHTDPPQRGTKVVVYGAMRRGEHGIVCTSSKPFRGPVSFKGDVGIGSQEEMKPMTDGGDCGALYVDVKAGPLAMHHCLAGGGPYPYESFGIPLAAIMAKHALLGGSEQESDEVQQLKQSSTIKESRNIAHFDTKVIKVPTGDNDEGDSNVDSVPEDRNIAKFDVRVVTMGTEQRKAKQHP